MKVVDALGPLEAGAVAAWRQTRLEWFLVSSYGGLARLAAAQSLLAPDAGAAAMNAAALAIVTVVRPAPLLPEDADRTTPFAAALALAGLEGGLLQQPFLRQLQGFVPALPRTAVEAAADRRTNQLRGLWTEVTAALAER